VSDTIPLWHSRALDGVAHGFAGRRGGVSAGALASLNCGLGSGDDAALVDANRRRAADAVLPGAALLGLYQVHGRDCVRVNAAWSDADRPHADAMASDRPGILLGILTADCAPVLLADTAAGVVGAAHAGWRGALAGVTDATIERMVALGADASRIRAAVGPCIALASYEVDRTLLDAFTSTDPANEAFFRDGQRADRWQFDLEAYVAARLAAAGVGTVDCMGLDTYARTDDFYSFRRATHRGEPTYGRQMSMIGLAQT
jgi:polyphenol oxidase